MVERKYAGLNQTLPNLTFLVDTGTMALKHQFWIKTFTSKLSWLTLWGGAIAFFASATPALAQLGLVPDTAPDRSTNTTVNPFNRQIDFIRGGTRPQNGINLFHSFQEFNVGENRGIYFEVPGGVENIFSRVTGADPSDILGTLGVINPDQTLGNANMFFINPNGILFGPNARLDVGGSFTATTANAIGFGEAGFFSATNPEVPSNLLTVNPSAFLFNQIPVGNIANNSRVNAGRNPTDSSDTFGLRVADGHSFLLLGGNLTFNQGGLAAFDGRIDLGAVAGTGTVGLNVNGDSLSLRFPDDLPRSDVTLTGSNGLGAGFIVTNTGRGSISITARNIDVIAGSTIRAGILGGQSSNGVLPGNIVLDATGEIEIADGSYAFNEIYSNATGTSGDVIISAGRLVVRDGGQVGILNSGEGTAGNLVVRASDTIELSGDDTDRLSGLFSQVSSSGNGNSGEIYIETPRLTLSGALIGAGVFGQGKSDRVRINATENIILEGASYIFNIVASGATGNSGGIEISTNSLLVIGGAQIVSDVIGRGNSGEIRITARDLISIDGRDRNNQSFPSAIMSSIQEGATRIAEGVPSTTGGIYINTGTLSLTNRAQLSSVTEGEGNPGDIIIEARNRVFMQNTIIISEVVEQSGIGDAGDIQITTGTLELRDAAALLADTEYRGNAGNIVINARDAVIIAGRGPSAARLDVIQPSQITSTVDFVALDQGVLPGESTGVGEGGDITIRTGSLSLADDGFIRTTTFGEGDAGNIDILANRVSVEGGGLIAANTAGNGDSGSLTVRASEINLAGISPRDSSASTLSTAVSSQATGDGGQLTIVADQLSVSDRALITTETTAQGNAGIIDINTSSLNLTDRSSITSSTSGQGNTGTINIQAGDRISLTNNSNITSEVEQGATGNSQQINLRAPTLSLFDSSGISTATSSTGNAGVITIQNANSITLDNSTISSAINDGATATQPSNIDIQTRSLSLTNGAEVRASTSGQGDAGSIIIRDAENVNLANSTVSTAVATTTANGQGGNITVGAETLSLNRSSITSSTSGQGNTGTINIQSDDRITLDNRSQITSTVNQGAVGDSQSITLQTPDLNLSNNSIISAATSGRGNPGSIRILNSDRIRLNDSTISTQVNSRAIATQPGDIRIQTEVLTLDNNAQLTASTSGRGNAGNIFVSGVDQVSLSNSFIATTSSSNARGTGGDIRIQTGELEINDSNITARSLGRGNAGEITLDVDGQLRSTGSRIITSTARTNTQGGTVNIQAGDVVLSARSQINARSVGRGLAGDIVLNVSDRLQLLNSDITTSASQASGGDIQINATRSRDGSVTLGTRGIVLLEGNSDITTNSQGDGGNITIGGVGIIAFDDSDIISRSSAERGGDITLSTLFSEPSPPGSDPNFDNNGQVDLNAEGALAAGQITTPDTSTIQNSLLDLPNTAVDVTQLLANSCIVQTQEGGTFLVTGTGGLPQRPGDGALTPYSTGEVRPLPQDASQQDWQRGDAIVEPQGVYQLSDGRLVMSRECE